MNLITQEFSMVQDKIFGNYFKKLGGSSIKNIVTYLELNFPILFSYEYENKIYLSYVLSYDDFDYELNIITTYIPDYEILREMINANKSIFDLFDAEYENFCLYFGYKHPLKSKKSYSSYESVTLGAPAEKLKLLENYHNQDYLVEDLLPEEDFYLEKNLVNKISLNLLDFYFQMKLKSYDDKKLNYSPLIEQKYKYRSSSSQKPMIENKIGIKIKYFETTEVNKQLLTVVSSQRKDYKYGYKETENHHVGIHVQSFSL